MARRNPFMSKKLAGKLLDDFSLFGSMPFYVIVTLVTYFAGNRLLFERLAYGFLLSFIVIVTIKHFHYKDRPQKEEFTMFMERIAASSFPSTHSLGVTGIGLLISISYPYPWVIALASALCLLVYIQRYVSKKHFVIDIVASIAIAIAETVLIVKVVG
ncbi:phosphatase PAP2 family protein [Candidatus Woesearchaeota archaeon]|nr:phosphatase PAP2 family protein [Candidatus Woesearchaeota archaeon]